MIGVRLYDCHNAASGTETHARAVTGVDHINVVDNVPKTALVAKIRRLNGSRQMASEPISVCFLIGRFFKRCEPMVRELVDRPMRLR